MFQIVFDRQWHRFRILFELYKRSNADIDTVYDLRELSMSQGIKLLDFLPAWKYLQMEELIRVRFGGSTGRYQACLTHSGLKAIEEVFFNENEPTYYFPAFREMQH
ncbi:hypothetical protein [Microscilla marina]|nr:hypothetical protein [Microscilla marina]